MHTLSLTRITALLTLVIALLGGASFTHALDVNRASAEELTELKGIGPKRAEAIVRYREANGPFASREALLAVPGVGPKLLEDNAAMIELGSSSTSKK